MTFDLTIILRMQLNCGRLVGSQGGFLEKLKRPATPMPKVGDKPPTRVPSNSDRLSRIKCIFDLVYFDVILARLFGALISPTSRPKRLLEHKIQTS